MNRSVVLLASLVIMGLTFYVVFGSKNADQGAGANKAVIQQNAAALKDYQSQLDTIPQE